MVIHKQELMNLGNLWYLVTIGIRDSVIRPTCQMLLCCHSKDVKNVITCATAPEFYKTAPEFHRKFTVFIRRKLLGRLTNVKLLEVSL